MCDFMLDKHTCICLYSVAAEPGVTGEVPTDGQAAPSAESADGEPRSEAKEEQETAAAPPEEEGEVESSTITVEELAPATANIANALVCVHVATMYMPYCHKFQ